jgi:ABC-type phosphate transport system permease subunit
MDEAIELRGAARQIQRERGAERIFRWATFVAAILVLALLGGVVLSLLKGSWPALSLLRR